MLRVAILGAGFGGLELATMLSEEVGGERRRDADRRERRVRLRLLEARRHVRADDARRRPAARTRVREAGRARSSRETITAIDPEARRVTTDAGVHEADVLVVALGADYDLDATPGLAEAGNEFYSVAGAERLGGTAARRSRAATRSSASAARRSSARPRRASARCCCTTTSSTRGVRDACEITLVIPFATPVPPSPDTSAALLGGVRRARDHVRPGPPRRLARPGRGAAVLDDGSELPFDLFLGVPRHRAPDVVIASGMTEDGYMPGRAPQTLETRFPGVYAVGDVATVGVPKAGVFAEGAARVVAAQLDRRAPRRRRARRRTAGRGSCYVEFGGGRVGRVDVDFLSGPKPTGMFREPSAALVAEKEQFGSSRRARWFGSPA